MSCADVGGQPHIVRLHTTEVPEFTTDFVQAVGRIAFEHEMDRGTFVGGPQFIVFDTDVGHDDNRAAMVETREP